MPDLTFRITSVSQLREGETDGKAWTQHSVSGIAHDGTKWKFTTFDVEWRKHLNEEVTAAYKYNSKYGENNLGSYKASVKGATPPPSPAATGSSPLPGPRDSVASPARSPVQPDFELKVMATLDAILEQLLEIRKHFS